MKAFVIRLVVLSVLWAVCEMLLPDGKTRQAVRFTVSLMVMLSLMSFSAELINLPMEQTADIGVFSAAEGNNDADRSYLRSRANQIRQYVLDQAQRAGYEGETAVYLNLNGAVERIELKLWTKKGSPPLMSTEDLIKTLSQTLGLKEEQFQLQTKGDGN